MLQRHGTFDGWTKHTTEEPQGQIATIIDRLRLTGDCLHHISMP